MVNMVNMCTAGMWWVAVAGGGGGGGGCVCVCVFCKVENVLYSAKKSK